MLYIIRKYLQQGANYIKLLGSAVTDQPNVTELLKDTDNNAVLARVTSSANIPQRKPGYAKGCLLIVKATGADAQGVKGLYENVGTHLLSKFNVIGQVADPEIVLASGRMLIGQSNGMASDVAITGDITISNTGEVSVVSTELTLANGQILVGGSDGKADPVAVSGVVTLTNAGVASFGALYEYSHRVVVAGVTEGTVDADGEVSINNWRIAAGDVAIATVYDASHLIHVRRAKCFEGRLDITLSAAGGTNTRVNYVVYRAVNTAASNPTTTLAPTTLAATEGPISTDSPTTLPPTTAAPTTT